MSWMEYYGDPLDVGRQGVPPARNCDLLDPLNDLLAWIEVLATEITELGLQSH
jgi:hypothetical protein